MHTKLIPSPPVHDARVPLRRRVLAVFATLVLAGTAGTVAAAPASATAGAQATAQAALTLVTCSGQESTTYSPGITNTAALVTITTSATYGPCLHVNGLQITTWSGSSYSQGQTMAGCTELELPEDETSTSVIRWSNGQTSTWEYTAITQNVAGNFVIVGVGEITDGLYEGAIAQRELVLPGLVEALQACATPTGLTGVSGLFTFTITAI
ncbi:hypothetical protein [Cellulomonas sp.]|uniref:hypothetical protein n=1 Tax=Cellulomonas sp. TaxID=40001 RepID=UPI0028122217|nr:hypothetical protein [Cellulomonas sp.]